jgi:hypothetical protein
MSIRHGLIRAVKTVVIADEGTTSTECKLNGLTLAGIVTGAGWVTVNVTFTASVDGGATFLGVYDNADPPVLRTLNDVQASRYSTFDPADFAGIVHSLKLVSSAAQTSGPQTVHLILVD